MAQRCYSVCSLEVLSVLRDGAIMQKQRTTGCRNPLLCVYVRFDLGEGIYFILFGFIFR